MTVLIEAVLWGLVIAANVAPPAELSRAAPQGGLAVEASGPCPSGEAVMAALLPALGSEARGPAVDDQRAHPHVSDLGDRFEISAFGQTRQYVDAARDCAERARVAAVFITLALNPPTLGWSSAAAPANVAPVESASRSATSNPPPRAVEGQRRWADLAAGARVDGPVGGASSAGVAAGAELRGAIGWGHVGVAATAGILAPTEGRVSFVTVHEQRFPLSLALALRGELWRGAVVAGALGVSFVPLTLRADGLMTSDPATRLDTGAHLAFGLTFPALAWHAAPFLELHADYFPRPYALDVDPLGEIGSTSRFWVGASLGVALEAR